MTSNTNDLSLHSSDESKTWKIRAHDAICILFFLLIPVAMTSEIWFRSLLGDRSPKPVFVMIHDRERMMTFPVVVSNNRARWSLTRVIILWHWTVSNVLTQCFNASDFPSLMSGVVFRECMGENTWRSVTWIPSPLEIAFWFFWSCVIGSLYSRNSDDEPLFTRLVT